MRGIGAIVSAAAAAALLLSACGGDNDGGGGSGGGAGIVIPDPRLGIPGPTAVEGSWHLDLTVVGGTAKGVGTAWSADAYLTRRELAVNGNWVSSGGDLAKLDGSIDGRVLTFTMSQTVPCAGQFSGTLHFSADNRSVSGIYSGSDCQGTYTMSVTGVRR